MPLPAKLDKVPPVKLISATVKLLDGSERLKIKVAESPPWRLDLLLATEIVGNGVSIENTRKLFFSKSSSFCFLYKFKS